MKNHTEIMQTFYRLHQEKREIEESLSESPTDTNLLDRRNIILNNLSGLSRDIRIKFDALFTYSRTAKD